jgi:hypothetical protein
MRLYSCRPAENNTNDYAQFSWQAIVKRSPNIILQRFAIKEIL